jgi:NAD(P)-dependent dehydrogenase (short-subunit alcohol dehydrogenase family)/enoyl-CoA hydratase/carnithine racemase
MSWTLTRDGAVATLEYSNPPENRISFAALEALLGHLDGLAADEAVSVVILASGVAGVFAAGADRDDIARLAKGDAGPDRLALWARAGAAFEALPQPVIAVLDGRAVSGGCELALACTLRIGSPRASFAQGEILVGAMPGAGATARLPRIAGPGLAARMILGGAQVAAEDARAAGLLDDVVDDPRESARAYAAELAARPRAALVAAKAALVEGRDLPVAEAQRREQRRFLGLLAGRGANGVPRPSMDTESDYASRLRLDGRGFLVFGAGAGMGLAAARALAQAGARVACVDRDAALAKSAAEQTGGVALSGDVTDRADVERIIAEAATRIGPLRGLVDVVGVARLGPLADLNDVGWQEQFAVVVDHAFLAIQVAGPAIAAAGGGSITFVGSISGVARIDGQTAYGAAKAALHHLVATSGAELARSGVRVNAVAPGWVRTPRLEAAIEAERWARIDARIPRGSAATPDEIAGPLLFLASDLASYITGQVLVADGGLAGTLPGVER